MLRRGKYGRYVHLIESFIGFFGVNLAFLIASLTDNDVTGFRWKVTLMLVNLCYLPVVYYRQRWPQGRSLHLDIIAKNAFASVGIHALFFFACLTFLDSWVNNMSFYLWFYGLLWFLLPLSWASARLALKYFRRRGVNIANAVIIGAGECGCRLRSAMESDPGYGYRFLGYFDDVVPSDCGDYRGSIDELKEFMNHYDVNEIYYTLAGDDNETLRQVVTMADNAFAKFFFVPQLSPYVGRVTEVANIDSMPIMSLRRNPLGRLSNRVVKRVFDVCFSMAFLVVSPLVFVPVAVAIKLSSPGPVFFRQKRTGYMGKDFYCLKFRTMTVNPMSDTLQAVRGDERVTRVGRFLRHTSIDELPQFVNVLKGDMSVVGPRPHMIKQTNDYQRLIERYMVRHSIKPGITGWAQIRGYRGQTEALWQMEKRVECDMWYIENWNLVLDIKIIILTIIGLMRPDNNAY